MKIEIRRRGFSEIYELWLNGRYVDNSDCIADLTYEANELIKR